MKRKRTNLDTSEANFIYAKVMLEFNKQKDFAELAIPQRNKLIDSVCKECIKIANVNDDDRDALIFEIESYKLSEEEKKKFYSNEVYENNLEKPKDFNNKMEQKYSRLIKKLVTEKFLLK